MEVKPSLTDVSVRTASASLTVSQSLSGRSTSLSHPELEHKASVSVSVSRDPSQHSQHSQHSQLSQQTLSLESPTISASVRALQLIQEKSSPSFLLASCTGPAVLVTGGAGYLGRHMIKYLVSKFHRVYALASDAAGCDTIKKLGAIAIECDLTREDSVSTVSQAMSKHGVVACFHCAAFAGAWAVWSDAIQASQVATRNICQACAFAGASPQTSPDAAGASGAAGAAGASQASQTPSDAILVQKKDLSDSASEASDVSSGSSSKEERVIRLIYVSSDVEQAGRHMHNYGMVKKLVEIEALKYNKTHTSGGAILEVVVLRPRFIWGGDDNVVLPVVAEQVRSGAFKWPRGEHYLTSTAHVQNVCHAMWVIAAHGRDWEDAQNVQDAQDAEEKKEEKHVMRKIKKLEIGGSIYNVTDGMDVEFRGFVKDMLRCMKDGDKLIESVDAGSNGLEGLFGVLTCGLSCCCCEKVVEPTLKRLGTVATTKQSTIHDGKIRGELGFTNVVKRKEGLIDLAKRNGKSSKDVNNMDWETC